MSERKAVYNWASDAAKPLAAPRGATAFGKRRGLALAHNLHSLSLSLSLSLQVHESSESVISSGADLGGRPHDIFFFMPNRSAGPPSGLSGRFFCALLSAVPPARG
jgi:hypothetical protein